jgi:hypothetical protein
MVFKLSLIAIVLFVNQVSANEFPVTARLFAGAVKAEPKELNTEMTAQSLEKFDSIYSLGVEATYAAFKYLDAGFRYTKRYAKKEEIAADPLTDYKGQIDQDSVSVVVRVPFLRTAILRADAFAAIGGTNTSFTIKSATQDGTLTRKGTDGWFGAPITSFGGSFAVGYRSFYLVFEGGFESNKVKDLKHAGNINDNVQVIDLSGSYATVGLMFDGVTAHSK